MIRLSPTSGRHTCWRLSTGVAPHFESGLGLMWRPDEGVARLTNRCFSGVLA